MSVCLAKDTCDSSYCSARALSPLEPELLVTTSIDLQDLPSHPGTRVTKQEHDHVRHVIRLPHGSPNSLGLKLFDQLWVPQGRQNGRLNDACPSLVNLDLSNCLHWRRGTRTWSNDIHPNVGPVLGQGLRQPIDAMLARAVGRQRGMASDARTGRDVDDGPLSQRLVGRADKDTARRGPGLLLRHARDGLCGHVPLDTKLLAKLTPQIAKDDGL